MMMRALMRRRSFAAPRTRETTEMPRMTPVGDALAVLREHATDDDGSIELPVQPLDIARQIGVPVFTDPTLDAAEVVVASISDKPMIVVSETGDPKTKRWNAARAVAFVIERQKARRVATTERDPYVSRFADALIMPRPVMESMTRAEVPLHDQAERFGVPEPALRSRAFELGFAS